VGTIDNLLQLLEKGPDTALLRYGLGNEYFKAERWEQASEHLERAVALEPGYSAAWKLYGRALSEAGRREEAVAALRRGIEVAEAKGDVQAAKEMQVFLRRAEKAAEGP
jgi:tetratricopeptide (TPR) repeat protein